MKFALVLLVLVLVSSCGVEEVHREDAVLTKNTSIGNDKWEESQLKIVPLKVKRPSAQRFDWQRQRSATGTDLIEVEFNEDGSGWATSTCRDVFKFLPGGEKILKVRKIVDKQGCIAGFSIVDNSTVVLALNSKISESKPGFLRIVRTLDAGVTWSHPKILTEGYANKLISDSRGIVWLIGGRPDGSSDQLIVSPLLMRSMDGGENWLDESDSFSDLIDSSASNVNELTDIRISNSGSIHVIVNNNQTWKSTDNGESWSDQGILPPIGPYQTRFLHVSDDIQRFVSSGSGVHGTYTIFLNKLKEKEWSATSLENFRITDAVFKSRKEVFACGSEVPENSGESNNSRDNPVILYSADGGGSWEIVYESGDATVLYSIAIIRNEKVVAVGENGMIVTAEL